jgi:hypothetical protein
MIYIRHYFPGVKIEEMSFDDFAMLSEDALWMHSQTLMVQQANSLGMLGGVKPKK